MKCSSILRSVAAIAGWTILIGGTCFAIYGVIYPDAQTQARRATIRQDYIDKAFLTSPDR